MITASLGAAIRIVLLSRSFFSFLVLLLAFTHERRRAMAHYTGQTLVALCNAIAARMNERWR